MSNSITTDALAALTGLKKRELRVLSNNKSVNRI